MSKRYNPQNPRHQMAVRMAIEGCDRALISAELGYTRDTVNTILWSARASGQRIPHAKSGRPGPMTVIVPVETANAFHTHAHTRGITSQKLVVDLLDVMARDQLVDAILDDAHD